MKEQGVWRYQLSQQGWNGVREVIRGGSRCRLNSRIPSVSAPFGGVYWEAGTRTWDPEVFLRSHGTQWSWGSLLSLTTVPSSWFVVTFVCILKYINILGDFCSLLFNVTEFLFKCVIWIIWTSWPFVEIYGKYVCMSFLQWLDRVQMGFLWKPGVCHAVCGSCLSVPFFHLKLSLMSPWCLPCSPHSRTSHGPCSHQTLFPNKANFWAGNGVTHL